MRLKHWGIVIGAVIVALWLSGALHRYVPGQEDNPALAKASLCGVASSMHLGIIDAARETGLIRENGINEDGIYVFTVDEALWAEQPIESKELLAIAGWCQVTTKDGKGIAVVVGARDSEEFAEVVDGVFSVRN